MNEQKNKLTKNQIALLAIIAANPEISKEKINPMLEDSGLDMNLDANLKFLSENNYIKLSFTDNGNLVHIVDINKDSSQFKFPTRLYSIDNNGILALERAADEQATEETNTQKKLLMTLLKTLLPMLLKKFSD